MIVRNGGGAGRVGWVDELGKEGGVRGWCCATTGRLLWLGYTQRVVLALSLRNTCWRVTSSLLLSAGTIYYISTTISEVTCGQGCGTTGTANTRWRRDRVVVQGGQLLCRWCSLQRLDCVLSLFGLLLCLLLLLLSFPFSLLSENCKSNERRRSSKWQSKNKLRRKPTLQCRNKSGYQIPY